MLALGLTLLIACSSESTVSGVLVDVESSSLTRVDSFVLRADDGREIRFRVAPEAERSAHAPSPGHLRQHMTHGDRLTVVYRETSDGPLALSVNDNS